LRLAIDETCPAGFLEALVEELAAREPAQSINQSKQ